MSSLAKTIKKVEFDNFDHVDPQTLKFLKSFYSRVVHQPITFTAFEFFTLNLPLLTSIATGVVSYLVILIQFYAS
jgi:7tm Chemosensory receptor